MLLFGFGSGVVEVILAVLHKIHVADGSTVHLIKIVMEALFSNALIL